MTRICKNGDDTPLELAGLLGIGQLETNIGTSMIDREIKYRYPMNAIKKENL